MLPKVTPLIVALGHFLNRRGSLTGSLHYSHGIVPGSLICGTNSVSTNSECLLLGALGEAVKGQDFDSLNTRLALFRLKKQQPPPALVRSSYSKRLYYYCY